MKAIILAAGMGKRTGLYGEEKPKCLFEFNGKTTLENQLVALKKNNVRDVVIVVGYKKEMIIKFLESHPLVQEMNITLVENPEYATTNTSYSWWLARNYIMNGESLMHFNSDLIFFPELIGKLIRDERENLILVDKNAKLDDSKEQVILDGKDKILQMDKRNIPGAHGKGAGVAKFSGETVKWIVNKLEEFIVGKKDKNQNFYGILRLAVRELDFYGMENSELFFKEYNTERDYEAAKETYDGLKKHNIKKAVILSAGKGDRLKHFTENKPTGLLEVDGKPILHYQLKALQKIGINEVIIVVGYKGFMIREYIKNNPELADMKFVYIENDNYNAAGTAYSWWLTKKLVENENSLLHLHSDLLFEEDLLHELIFHPHENVVCIDRNVSLNDSMEQVILDGNTKQILYMDKRNIPGAQGKAVGLAKFSKNAIDFMIKRIEAHHSLDDNQQAFYGIIRKAVQERDFYGLEIGTKFFKEINTEEDYRNIGLNEKEKSSVRGLPEKPSVIMLYGLPASGKTMASRKIRDYFEKEMHTEVLSTFKIREERNLLDLYSEEQREKVYDEISLMLDQKLKKNIHKCIILDGNFNKRERRKKIYDVVKKHNCDFYILECLVENQIELEKRLAERKIDFGFENAAANLELHNMIQNTGQQLSMEEFTNPVPIIISYNSEKNVAKLKPQQYVVRGIIDALSHANPENATEIIFVRHGETDQNKRGVLQGQLDFPLNEKGLEEARELGGNLKKLKIDGIFSSDLTRAMQCAEEIQRHFPEVKVKKSSLLRERNFGEHQGKNLIELGYHGLEYSEMVRHFYECSCPGGETNQQMLERLEEFLHETKKLGGKRILVATHGGIVMTLLNYLLGEEIKFKNSRQHKNGFVSYLKLDENLRIVDSLINKHVSDVVEYLR